jgi:signal transduction histidine kinase
MTAQLTPPQTLRGEHTTVPPPGMASQGPEPNRQALLHGLAVGLSVALGIALLASAVSFSIADGTSETAGLGTRGIYAEASLSAAAATRNRAVQAQLLANAQQQGIVTAAEVEGSIASTVAAAGELSERTQRLIDELADDAAASEIELLTSDFLDLIDAHLDAISDRTPLSLTFDTDELDQAYLALTSALVDERDRTVARIYLARDTAGRLADAARFLVVLLVPLGVLAAYRARARRQQHSSVLREQLDKEHAINRTKDELIANLSHELRTPLTSIYGFAIEMTDDEILSDPALATELARVIAAEASELGRMLEDLLTAATADHGSLVVSMEEVDPVAEVAEVLAPVKLTGVTIPTDMEPASIMADRFRLRQIVRNLVSNGRRHGGPNMTVIGRVDDGRYSIDVVDDGPGVPLAIEDRLFSRFIHEGTAPLTTGSVGLGLAIAHLLTELTGGAISYRREGSTTVFSVTYQLVETSEDAVENGIGRRLPADYHVESAKEGKRGLDEHSDHLHRLRGSRGPGR